MNAVSTRSESAVMQLGHFRLEVVSGGRFRMDGGAMFGVVPKTLWSRYAEPDDRNRIPQAANCLLVDTGRNKVLIDTGYGGKLSEKEKRIYAAEQGSPLIDSLAQIGVAPDEIDTVVLSHLHFDHAGGGTESNADELGKPTFSNAEYVVQRREWMLATADLPELRGTYPSQNLLPLRDADCLRLIDGDVEIVPGIHSIVTGGHTPAHQSVLVESGGCAAVYLAELCPTTAHLPIRWGMSYDLDVVQLRRKKWELLARIVDQGWWAFFDHDPQTTHARLARHNKRDFEVVI
jgi:glyoxylase-like metal-dependent hydrolase (beta-lactamase superfamily II)